MNEAISIVSIAAFLKRKVPGMFAANYALYPKQREAATNWIAWNMGRNQVIVIADNGKIIAAGIGRAIAIKEDARHSYRVDESGKILYVSVAASRSLAGFKALLGYAKMRWPNCDRIMFNRKKNKRVMNYDINRFLHIVERMGN